MERSMILYLSGPITGVDNYQEIFRTARGRLTAMGYKVINPAEMIGVLHVTVHRWFANKACPGDYLYQRHGAIADAVNAKLGTGTEQIVSSFPATPFTVRVIINDLNYREGPGMSYAVKGQTGKGVFTITEVQDGWGKLKSGAGWIYLENPAYCTILDDGQTEAQKATEKLAQDIAAQLKSSGCDAAAVLKRVSEILA